MSLHVICKTPKVGWINTDRATSKCLSHTSYGKFLEVKVITLATSFLVFILRIYFILSLLVVII